MDNDNIVVSHFSKYKPTLFQSPHERAATQLKKEKKNQDEKCRLGRDPEDKIGKDPEGWSDCLQREQGRENLPGVSNRTSEHILSVTEGEITAAKHVKSRQFIDRYYKAYDNENSPCSIWTIPADLEKKIRYNPKQITIELLETADRNFVKHSEQVTSQLSCDAAERHAREYRRQKNIELIGICLSALTSLGGTVTGFVNDGSKQSTLRITQMGYAQVVFGIVIGVVIKYIGSWVTEHSKAARNLDATLNWFVCEEQRLKLELRTLEKPFLEALRASQPSTESMALPIGRQLAAMNYTWVMYDASLSEEKSLFESIARLQKALFGFHETADSVETALSHFRARAVDRGVVGSSKIRASGDELTDLDALARIYNCVIVLVSEIVLPNDMCYQIINGALTEAKPAETEEESKADEEAPVANKPTQPSRYMMLYTPGNNKYEPILAPFNARLDEVRATLERLSLFPPIGLEQIILEQDVRRHSSRSPF